MFHQKLSSAERLVLWRRRLGLSQQEMCWKLNIGMRLYLKWELGREEVPLGMLVPEYLDDLENFEVYRIYRKRAKLSREDLAGEINVSPYWLTQMENGEVSDVTKLEQYWRRRQLLSFTSTQ